MENTWPRSKSSGEAAKGGALSRSTLNITKFAPIFVLIFAAITQILAWIDAITLSAAQQVTIWLVVAGLIVLFSIADMACRAYLTGKGLEASAARPPGKPTSQPAAPPPIPADDPPPPGPVRPAEGNTGNGSQPPASVAEKGNTGNGSQPEEGNPGDGSRLPVKMSDVFPHGCYLVQDSINEAQDCDDSMEIRRVVDRRTSKWVFSCQVTDMHPELKGRPRQTEVRVVAEQVPDLSPPVDGSPFIPIEFEGLTAAAPPKIDQGRAAYTSVRATGVRRIEPAPAHGPGPEGDGVTAGR